MALPRQAQLKPSPQTDHVIQRVLLGELTIEEAARILGVTRDAVRQYVKRIEVQALDIPEPIVDKIHSDDINERLEGLALLLEKRVRESLMTGQLNSGLASLLRELRGLIKDLHEQGQNVGHLHSELLQCHERYDRLYKAVIRHVRDPDVISQIAAELDGTSKPVDSARRVTQSVSPTSNE